MAARRCVGAAALSAGAVALDRANTFRKGIGVRSPRIVVLLLAEDTRFVPARYLLACMVRVWREAGIPIEVVRGVEVAGGTDDAAVIIPHFDVTETPPAYRAVLAHLGPVLNVRLWTIAKSSHSTLLVRGTDTYAGPVIVKTDRNYGGLPEMHLRLVSASAPARLVSRAAARMRRLLAQRVAWSRVEVLQPEEYPVYGSLREIPPGVFDNPHLVVEKFLPEIDGADYCVRYAYCLGGREIAIRLRSRLKIVKASSAHGCDVLPAVPPEIGAIRRRIGMDYGKLDYVVRDGTVIPLDVNRTPSSAALERFGLTDLVARHLAGAAGAWPPDHRVSRAQQATERFTLADHDDG